MLGGEMNTQGDCMSFLILQVIGATVVTRFMSLQLLPGEALRAAAIAAAAAGQRRPARDVPRVGWRLPPA